MNNICKVVMVIVSVGMVSHCFGAYAVEISDWNDDEYVAEWFGKRPGESPLGNFEILDAGGNPDSHIKFHTSTNSSNGIYGRVMSTVVINPADYGGISEINFQIDTRGTFSAGGGVYGMEFVIEQDGIFYYADDNSPSPSMNQPWATRNITLSSENFRDSWYFDEGTLSPDFSSTAAPIRLGFGHSIGVNSGSWYQAYMYDDNFKAEIIGIPEPATLALLALGGLVLRKRK